MRIFTLVSALLLTTATPVLAADLAQPEFVGEVVLPSALSVGGVKFGGISDLSWDAAAGRYLAISDDRVEYGPARYYDIALTVEKGKMTGIDIAARHELMAPGGAHFAKKGVDPEGIALDAAHARIFWSSERDEKNIPALYVADIDGGNAKSIPLPDAFLPNADGTRGVLSNLGFEGLDLSADGKTLIAANENALAQDGGKATLTAGSASRIVLFDTETLTPKAQYIYMTDKIPAAPNPENGWADNGVSAISALPDGRLIVIERNFSDGHGFNIRFYVADTTGATDVNGMDKVEPGSVTPVAKTAWFSLVDGDHGLKIDNIEAIAFGPTIDGKQTMLLASDDNFSADQATKFTLFTVDPSLAAH